MKKLFLVMSLLMAQTGFAAIELGVYRGVDADGNDCSVEFLRRDFERGVMNPLNERYHVHVDFGAKRDGMVLSHPVVLGTEDASVGFDHDHLQGHKGVTGGAKLVKLHVEDHKPSHFHYFADDWKNAVKEKLSCFHLHFHP